ncbi:MAG: hypothetical protein HQL38_20795, partial [Alphaproteobacteria bacterium]|nr:hypothetical protein [Alphaproteobacteria bacterium]
MKITRPGTLSEAVQRSSSRGDSLQPNFSEFLDEFYIHLRPSLRDDDALAAMLVDEPAPVGAIVDAFLAATAEHLMHRSRFLRGTAYNDGRNSEEAATHFRDSPTAFRRRMLFVCADPLRRARMPKDARWWAFEEF